MRRWIYFDKYDQEGWPAPETLAPYFAPGGERWFHRSGNDSAGLEAEGVDGTDRLAQGKGRIDIDLYIWGFPGVGVLLVYRKYGGGLDETFSSKGDLRRLREWVRNLHNDPLPVGLFVPFESAYEAVKEFIETDGALPKSIEWIANNDLPPGTFPDP